tara:strand:+ start:164 stop:448 length:285 start_codon:yes stop_codon:yes gene_type:complete
MASIKKDNINPSLDRITDQLQTKVTRQAFLKFRATTPKRTGNAKRKTKLKGSTIHAEYGYATKLDAGSSRKAPDGMSKPTSDFLDKLIRKIIRK